MTDPIPDRHDAPREADDATHEHVCPQCGIRVLCERRQPCASVGLCWPCIERLSEDAPLTLL